MQKPSNIYSFNLTNSTCFYKIIFKVDRYNPNNNKVTIKAVESGGQESVQDLANRILGDLNPSAYYYSEAFLASDLRINDGTKVGKAVRILFQNDHITTDEYTSMLPILKEMKENAENTSLTDEISTSQKDIITEFVGIYLEEIVSKIPNKEDTEKVLDFVLKFFGISGTNIESKVLADLLYDNLSRFNPDIWEHFILEGKFDKELFECFSIFGRIMLGCANLEGALKQSGKGVPKLEIIQKVIMEKLEELYKSKTEEKN